MTWSLIVVGTAGVLIGLRYRVFALIAATLLVILAGIATMWILDLPARRSLVSTIYLVLTLQGAYLLGLALTVLWRSR